MYICVCGALTGHGRVDAPDVGEQRDLRELGGERGRLEHLLLEDLGALGGAVERGDVELGERRLRAVRAGEHGVGVAEDAVEEVELHVLARQRLGVAALDREGLADVVSDIGGSGRCLRGGWDSAISASRGADLDSPVYGAGA